MRDIWKVSGIFYFNLLEFFVQVENIFVCDEVMANGWITEPHFENELILCP